MDQRQTDFSSLVEQIDDATLAESILGGELAFDESGDPRCAQFSIFQIEGGEYTLVTD